MSKAFTKETDHEVEDDLDEAPAIPQGAKNYITPAGLQRLRDELKQLKTIERPKVVEIVSWAAGNGDRSENGDYLYGKKRLREIDRRIRFLLKRLEIAEPVDPALQKNRDQVFFGATVTYADDSDRERTIRIVGIDEARIPSEAEQLKVVIGGETVGDAVLGIAEERCREFGATRVAGAAAK